MRSGAHVDPLTRHSPAFRSTGRIRVNDSGAKAYPQKPEVRVAETAETLEYIKGSEKHNKVCNIYAIHTKF